MSWLQRKSNNFHERQTRTTTNHCLQYMVFRECKRNNIYEQAIKGIRNFFNLVVNPLSFSYSFKSIRFLTFEPIRQLQTCTSMTTAIVKQHEQWLNNATSAIKSFAVTCT